MTSSPSDFTDFAEFSAYLDSLGLFHMEFGLHRILAALSAMRLTALPYLSVQVVGTNGKGSTAAFLAAMLQAHGLPTGLYLSPHFVTVRERILMGGQMLSPADWATAANTVIGATRDGGEKARLTYFELLTGMAAWLFADQRAEAAVFEAGLGGTGDATTALWRDLVLFTPIGLDHATILGPTLADIARDKAGAMVPGGVAVTGRQPTEVMQVLRQEAQERSTRLYLAGDLAAHDARSRQAVLYGPPRLDIPAARLRLAGPHQSGNAALALAGFSLCARMLGITPSPEALSRALTETFLPGRLQLLKLPGFTPGLLLDCAHNAPALIALGEALAALRIAPAALVFTCLGDKDLDAMAPLAAKLTTGPVFVPEMPGISRARPASEVAAALGERAVAVADPAAALAAVRGLEGTVMVCGSMYLLGELFAAPQN